jgi:hypothetical protein
MAMHVLQQAASLKVIAKELCNIHYDPAGCVFAHCRGPRKQNVVHYAAGQPADNFYAEFTAIVPNIQSHQAVTVSLDQFHTRALHQKLTEFNRTLNCQ